MRLIGLLIAIVLLCTFEYSAVGQVEGAGKSNPAPAGPTPTPTATPAPELSIKPSSLQIAATCGEIVTRNAVLEANGKIEKLEFLPLDLQAKDERAVIPAQWVSVRLDKTEIPDRGALSAPFTFNLTHARSGEFTGELQARYAGGRVTLPVVVKTKERWQSPLLVLLVGISISMAISYYREQGKPRDEVMVKQKRLQSEAKADRELAPEFRARLDAAAVEVEAHLDARKWDDARKALEQAELVLLKWRKGRADWKSQLEASDELLRRIVDAARGRRVAYLNVARDAVETAKRQAPDMDGPDKLRERLQTAADQLARYEELRAEIDRLGERATRSPSRRAEWSEKVERWRTRLEELNPNAVDGYNALKTEVGEAMRQVESEVATLRSFEIVAAKSGAGPSDFSVILPDASALGQLSVAEKAEWKLRAFRWVTYIIAVVLLAGVGFGELYVNKPTFGANLWSDYFTLFAWGFGAETTRAAFVELAKGWGIALGK
ncbi:MAG TPA: hypothetical protein VJ810_36315 [Blastocatellia bacterium]|nr:hypothetical protein [Blastocatellia bacterium]